MDIKQLTTQLSVGDLQMSPLAQSVFAPRGEIDSFRFGLEQAKNDTKNYIIMNEDGIERKTYYQDDQSNLAEARSLLKAFGDDQQESIKNKIANMRVLDDISARVHHIDSEMDSVLPRSSNDLKKSKIRPIATG